MNLWLDQLDILGGRVWDREVEEALQSCQGVIAVLSPESAESKNVMDELAFALDEEKLIIPVVIRPGKMPFRLRRLQYIDFTGNYGNGFARLLKALNLDQPAAPQRPGKPKRRSARTC